MRLSVHGLVTLLDEHVGVEFDFELMFPFDLCLLRHISMVWSLGRTIDRTYPVRSEMLSHLCKINLIVAVRVGHAILVAIRLPLPLVGRQSLELVHWSIPVPFEVNADATVHWAIGDVKIQISHTRLDDLVNDCFRLLIATDSHSHVASASSVLREHAAWQVPLQLEWEVNEAVRLAMMTIYQGKSAGVRSRIRLNNELIEEFVEELVVDLQDFVSDGQYWLL